MASSIAALRLAASAAAAGAGTVSLASSITMLVASASSAASAVGITSPGAGTAAASSFVSSAAGHGSTDPSTAGDGAAAESAAGIAASGDASAAFRRDPRGRPLPRWATGAPSGAAGATLWARASAVSWRRRMAASSRSASRTMCPLSRAVPLSARARNHASSWRRRPGFAPTSCLAIAAAMAPLLASVAGVAPAASNNWEPFSISLAVSAATSSDGVLSERRQRRLFPKASR
mmetsp:Transcript_13659/g.36762  ORF Transcript_13659/g.36762 Transcript_13659/m.36762 type:complete len:233 (-) Transcript_13659:521-1219(-)